MNRYTMLLSKKGYKGLINILIGLIPISLLLSPAFNSLLLAITLVFTLLHHKYLIGWTTVKESAKIRLFIIITLLYFLFHLIGLLYTENLYEGISIIRIRIGFFVVLLILVPNAKMLDFQNIMKLFLFGVLMSCLFVNINAIHQIIVSNGSLSDFFNHYIRFEYEKLMLYPIHPPYFGIYINLGLVMAYYLRQKKVIKRRALFYAVIMLLLVNLWLIASKMALLIFLILASTIVLHLLFRLLSLKAFFSMMLTLAVLMGYTLFNYNTILNKTIDLFQIENKDNIIGRFNNLNKFGDLTRRRNWESGLKAFHNNFWFGAGTGDAVDEMLKYRHEKSWIYQAKVNVHNQYIEEAVKFGVFGFLSFLICIVILGILAFKRKWTLFFYIVIILSMSTESVLNRHVGSVVLGFAIGMIVAKESNTSSVDKKIHDNF
ncbi:O-antigen ligase [Ulvibacterium sp.]|uniref:O-antigen ligase family protein n=1 Tax=Ulvibacterium sp. TaxID=2665914 RepID=UPI002633FC77|nr:O-antigen ligase family protein [Ulvibacterium sp.]